MSLNAKRAIASVKKVRTANLGQVANFLLPSLKLKGEERSGRTHEEALHRFLLRHFSGYTATAGNIFGYWKESGNGNEFYGEHRLFTVSFQGEEGLPELVRFLAELAWRMQEQCIYLETGEDAWLVFARKPEAQKAGRPRARKKS